MNDPVVIDSITEVRPAHADRVVVTGSHGGASAAHYARAVRAAIYVFNDAGVGRDGAGIAALGILAEVGIAAATVSHDSARIGEAVDTLERGIVSSTNRMAAERGVRAGIAVRELIALVGQPV